MAIGLLIALACALIALVYGGVSISWILRQPAGNARMQEIAAAIQTGAKAYLNRQVITISAIAVVIFILLLIWKDHATAAGFLVGAACSP